MKKLNPRYFSAALGLLAVFALWTALVCLVDVRPIGPLQSAVGLAGLNAFFHRLTGVHMSLYLLTDWLSLVPLGFALGFALLGLMQWIKRKQLLQVDRSILSLGGFYTVLMAAYALFEIAAVNYRPILIDGHLEVSYPSSTTLLVLCVMPTAIMQFHRRIKHSAFRRCIDFAGTAFIAFMVIGRLVSGVHWLSDIIGGALLSAGLDLLYYSVSGIASQNADGLQ